jgi:hypothetical protein
MKNESMNIYQSINAIMKHVPSIGKDRKNQQQGYNFRGIDDMYNALNPLLAEHGVFATSEVLNTEREERQTKSGGTLFYSILTVKFTFFATDGSSVTSTMIGEGMDSADKASNKAMSTAYKYALMQLFCIPTEDVKDTEYQTHEVAPKKLPPVPAVKLPEPDWFNDLGEINDKGKAAAKAVAGGMTWAEISRKYTITDFARNSVNDYASTLKPKNASSILEEADAMDSDDLPFK